MLELLTKRQRAIFGFIKDKIENRGYGPTVREIGNEFEISSPNGVMCHLRALEKKGLITREPNMSRAIQLSQAVIKSQTGLPVRGQLSDGHMQADEEQREQRVDFAGMFAKKSQFVLEVADDSMIDANIAEGDFVVVNKQRTAKAGQMVVAQDDDGEATVRYWHPEKSRKRVRLQPANGRRKASYAKNAKVLGVVSGVVRRI